MKIVSTGDIGAHDVQATFCAVVVDEWIRQGVRYAAIAPGSRSTPMALAVMDAQEANDSFVVDVFHDERSAAFAALGSALVSGIASIALCTSGTAAAHFHAAVIEADLSTVPLIVITADRPPELRDVGAPQTIDQTKLYGSAVRWFHDPGVPVLEAATTWRSLAARAVWSASGGHAGPVHLNLPFREPLVGRIIPELIAVTLDEERSPTRHRLVGRSRLHLEDVRRVASELSGRRGVVIAGRGCGRPDGVEVVAQALGWPVFAEPRAGCGSGTHTILHADALVRIANIVQSLEPDVVLRLGEPPASKALAQWVVASGAQQIHVSETGRTHDPDHRVGLRIDADVDEFLDALTAHVSPSDQDAWWGKWSAADHVVRSVLEERDDTSESWSAALATRAVMRNLPVGSHVVLSSSMPIRDVEWFAGDTSHVTVHANRGANGIDGVIATAIGVSSASGVPTFVLIGDVAVIHDASTLLSVSRSARDVRIVVVNNDGGGIFHHLPQATAVDSATFEAVYGTPHGIDFALLGESLGMKAYDFDRITRDVEIALNAPGPSIIQFRTDRTADLAFHRDTHEAIAIRMREFFASTA